MPTVRIVTLNILNDLTQWPVRRSLMRDGLAELEAVLSRLPVEREAALDLQSQNRVAQLVQVNLDGHSLVLVNVHLYWKPGESVERTHQVQLMLEWLSDLLTETAIVVCRDFNCFHHDEALLCLKSPDGAL